MSPSNPALIVDASALYAQANKQDQYHQEVIDCLNLERGELITSQFVVAEADYLIMTRLGLRAEHAFVRDLAAGTYQAECLTREEMEQVEALLLHYHDQQLGIADASLVVLSYRFGTNRILSLDKRAFRTVIPLSNHEAFTLLPNDG